MIPLNTDTEIVTEQTSLSLSFPSGLYSTQEVESLLQEQLGLDASVTLDEDSEGEYQLTTLTYPLEFEYQPGASEVSDWVSHQNALGAAIPKAEAAIGEALGGDFRVTLESDTLIKS